MFTFDEAMKRVNAIGGEVQRNGDLLRFYISTMQAGPRAMWECGFRLHAEDFISCSATTPEGAISQAIDAMKTHSPLFRKCAQSAALGKLATIDADDI